MMNWLFKYYVTALPGGSAPPPLVSLVSSFGPPPSEAKRARPRGGVSHPSCVGGGPEWWLRPPFMFMYMYMSWWLVV